jgi:DNA-directed RNA polymerase specialized sigma24 family protein
MDESMQKEGQAEAFEQYRVLLFSIAYRMTGSASDAEDLVQETYLRYQAREGSEIMSLKAYLTTISGRMAVAKCRRISSRSTESSPWRVSG